MQFFIMLIILSRLYISAAISNIMEYFNKHITVLPDFADFQISLNHDKANIADFLS